jgi:hypothetical protein
LNEEEIKVKIETGMIGFPVIKKAIAKYLIIVFI